MQTAQKEKIYSYAFKAVLSLILFFCLYNVVCILFLSPYSGRKLRSRVSSAVDAVETIIKHAGPKKTENIIYKSNLVNKTSDSSWANQIKRATLFAGPTTLRLVKAEEEIVQYEEVEETDNTEIVFKGMTEGVAYITIKKEIDGQWREHGFPTKVGEKIGNKKIVGGKVLDFTTNYVLQDIIYNAQRPLALNKKIVDLNEAGEFVGTRIVPGETYMKSTSKIKYKDENGNVSELWLKEYEKTFTVKDEKSYEQTEDNAGSTVSKEEAGIEGLTKQQKIVNKTKTQFEKDEEILRSILEEAERGY
ncbi:MAG: hypothetical protein H8D23_23040 [Candidatus Brocadiales bacterium]|nr:hypothetical protein [Candidatus Brocadiales bacterium]